MRWILLFVSCVVCQAQQGLSPETIALGQIKAKMSQNLGQLPNYTCGMTIERSVKLPRDRKAKVSDNIRLEVAMVDSHELFGWPGSNRIAEPDIATLVGGTIGNGDFGLHAGSVFLTASSVFTYQGPEDLNSQRALRYDYRVSSLNSGYRVRVGSHEAVIGYHGNFWVNPRTLDLLRLSLVAEELPEILGLARITNQLDYQRVHIGSGDFLLPLSGDLTLTDSSGEEHRNRTRFQNCRQYSGESILTFTEPTALSSAPATHEVPMVDLPPDFRVDLSLHTPIDSNQTTVGDQVQLKLDQPIRSVSNVVVPRGAVITARVMRLEHRGGLYELELALESLEFAQGRAELSTRSNDLKMLATSPLRMAQRPGRGMGGPTDKTLQPLVFQTNRLRLFRGFSIQWHSRLLKSEK